MTAAQSSSLFQKFLSLPLPWLLLFFLHRGTSPVQMAFAPKASPWLPPRCALSALLTINPPSGSSPARALITQTAAPRTSSLAHAVLPGNSFLYTFFKPSPYPQHLVAPSLAVGLGSGCTLPFIVPHSVPWAPGFCSLVNASPSPCNDRYDFPACPVISPVSLCLGPFMLLSSLSLALPFCTVHPPWRWL